MFRDSDFRYPQKHETFNKKQVPLLQQQQNNSKFVDERLDNIPNEIVKEIPTTFDAKYDPEHPDADWAVFLFAFV